MSTDPLLLPADRTRRMTNEQLIDLLLAASKAAHPEMCEYHRVDRCLLENAARRMQEMTERYQAARKANARMRHQRNEARAGVVGADWWNDAKDPESSYCDPSDRLSEAGYGEIVELTGAAAVETCFGFRIGPPPDTEDDEDRDFWFPTKSEAIAKLAELRAADAVARAKIDAGGVA
jgi:hypothetical protein